MGCVELFLALQPFSSLLSSSNIFKCIADVKFKMRVIFFFNHISKFDAFKRNNQLKKSVNRFVPLWFTPQVFCFCFEEITSVPFSLFFINSRCFNSSHKNNRFILGHVVHMVDLLTPETQGQALFSGKTNYLHFFCTLLCTCMHLPSTSRQTHFLQTDPK